MTTVKIHQIYYSPESFAALDKGFIPLDNTHGRSDWMEYWPIRQYFLNTPVGDDELVGFFSPRFFEKTGLTATDVHAHIEANPGHDVYLFNPYFHLASWHQNLFVQASRTHQGIGKVFSEVLALLDIHTDVDQSVMSSMDTVYCNYFVAKLDFWKKWLMVSEFIFQLSEENQHPIGKALRDDTNYHRGQMPLKIFVIERIASLLLNSMNRWNVKPAYLFKNMEFHSQKPLAFVEEMHKLDALKIAYKISLNERYLNFYSTAKTELTQRHGLRV
jgi:hypothetical protein